MKPALELTDSRRLTGANLFWDRPSAIIDVRIDAPGHAGYEKDVFAAWREAATRLLEQVGHGGEDTCHRFFDGGASFLISAPIDALYSMCELNEIAWERAVAQLNGATLPDVEVQVSRLRTLFAEEARPGLLAMQEAAKAHDVPFLWDDDEVSIGYGATAQIWPYEDVPDAYDIDWTGVGTIPAALVTGTNGKSTTVRMAAAIIEAAGKNAGLTSTDWIRVGRKILDTGDYSGTGGARTLMRHPETEIAVLETARGGLLRRGLGLERADAALITNVAADHLGDYGINTVPELREAKFIVRRALGTDGCLLLNADDPGMVEFAAGLGTPVLWFGLEPGRSPLRDHLAAGGTAAYLDQGWLMLSAAGESRRVVAVQAIPAALDGAARHNVQNALGAMLLCHQLGIEQPALRRGLEAFRGDETDNPGRGNWFSGNGARILVDFAHNEHGMRALAGMLKEVPAQRRILLMGQAGDRPDEDIERLTRAACLMQPSRLMACELPGYERGRAPGETPGIIARAAATAGVDAQCVHLFDSPVAAAAEALTEARAGDLLIFLALSQRQEVLDLVHRFIGDQAEAQS